MVPITSGLRRPRLRASFAVVAALSLVAAACSSDDDSSSDTSPPDTTPTATVALEPVDTEPAATVPVDTTPGDTVSPLPDDPGEAFPNLDPPTGEPFVIGLVNTEGTPGLDFPEIRGAISGAMDYLNDHGGYGGRPIVLESCSAQGSPETSQACAQELAGKNVELVMLGVDVFAAFATYDAAGIPVVGMLPLLPGDFSANALFVGGGNVFAGAATAAVAKDHFNAKSVGIVSSDTPGALATVGALSAALDVAGVAYTTISGGANETDAGYQGLMRGVAAANPDLIVSIFDEGGCVGTMRGRTALGIDIPVLTTSICSTSRVLEQVGDDAVGWSFIGVSTPEDTPKADIQREIMGNVLGIEPSEVDTTSLGFGGAGLSMAMSLAEYSNRMAADGLEVTGESLYAYIQESQGLTLWPGDLDLDCGLSEVYPSICSFAFPFAEYKAGGSVETIPGLEEVSGLTYLP